MVKLLVILVSLTSLTIVTAKLEEVFSWKQLDFKYPSEDARNEAIKNGEFIPGNSMPNAFLPWKNKLFITVPRWKTGIPSTLNYVSLNSTNRSPALIPYPNWESNRLTKDNETSSENTTVSLFRIDVDPCDRLWVLDTGLEMIIGRKLAHSPVLIIYDLKTDEVIRRYHLKVDQHTQNSLFANVIVDATPGNCEQAFAYFLDSQDFDLIVYSFADNDSWKVKHNFFAFDPLRGDINIAGLNFQWHDGVIGMTLGDRDSEGFRTAYFHSLIGAHEFSVNTRVLRNKTLVTNDNYHLFKIEGKKGENSQSTSSAFDMKTGTLFQSQISKDSLGCWNTKKLLNQENFVTVVQDHETNVFPNDIKIDEDRNLWILSDRMPLFIFDKMNLNETNYRILKITVDEAINGTLCEP